MTPSGGSVGGRDRVVEIDLDPIEDGEEPRVLVDGAELEAHVNIEWKEPGRVSEVKVIFL